MRIIGFTGGMGVGKSTAIEALRETYAGPVKLIKFAGPLYDMQEFIYGRIASVHKRPDNFIKDRKLLQWLGTDWGRSTISENIWADIWRAEVAEALNNPETIVVCDDVRFDNEAELVKSLGGIVVKITSDAASNRMVQSGLTGISNHASEAGVSHKFLDFVLENNSTKESYLYSLSRLYQMVDLGEQEKAEYVPA